MKSCYLDANVLVYFKNIESPHFVQASDLLKQLVHDGYQMVLSPLVIDEFLYAFKFHLESFQKGTNVFPELKRALSSILDLPGLVFTGPPLNASEQLEVLRIMEQFGLASRDAYHLLTMIKNEVKYFATFDHDFDKAFKQGVIHHFTAS